MLYLVLTILCSSMISIVMRLAQGRVRGRTFMLAANYFTCILLSAAHTGLGNLFPDHDLLPRTLALGLVNGLFYMLALVFNQNSIVKNGVVLSSVTARMGSLVLPLAAALCLFGEMPTAVQAIGAVLAMISIIWINYDGEKTGADSKMLLLALFFSEGAASAMSKIFGEWGTSALSGNFLLYTFSCAFGISCILALAKKESFGAKELLYGAMIGVPNFFASRFILRALEELPVVIVYPTRGVMCIVLITLAGVVFFSERLKKHQWQAMGLILLSVALLNL